MATTLEEPVVDNPFSFTVEELLEEGEKKFAVEDEGAEAYYYSGAPSYTHDPADGTYPPEYYEYLPGTYDDHCYCHACPSCPPPVPCPLCDIVECPNLCDIAICDSGPGSGVITSSHTDSIDIIAGSTDTLPGSTANEIVACNECGVAVGSNKQCGTGYVEKSFYIDGCIKVHETTDTHECTGQRTCNDGRFYKRTESMLSAEGGEDPGVVCPCCDLCPEDPGIGGDAECTTCTTTVE